ncbi:IreB family regulatory phosphoprotein [Gehongia tenuis]|uniref:UPF0297 protein H8696_04450 n=1 Tax=Gehongia tenuis TaxID=2763655 RepID=A0A926HQC1_9FIRM|nr:IreB family regulatory phosphoprotein [Gehongia tenuis]MBC8531096.1 IreB family regulatory phosphoprotein [Gehongia tenuis]
MDRLEETMHFHMESDNAKQVREIMDTVYNALIEKGYEPINQIVGYIMSGDPTYITSYNHARTLIRRLERDEILEEMVRYYLNGNSKK